MMTLEPEIDAMHTASSLGMSSNMMSDLKLKRTNLMKRRESQALLEGVRKNRCLSPSGLGVQGQSSDNLRH